MSVVILSTGYYPDPDIGKPIANGYIYVGVVDLDPEIVANQKTISVLQEDGSEVAVAQPLRTSAGGVPTYNGSPVTIIAASPYSLLVNDSEGVQKIYSPSNTGSSQANEDWTEEGAAVAFDSASTFTVVGDVTADYVTHRAVKLTQTLDDTGFVVSSVFGAVTTVTVRAATVDSGLTKVEYGQEVASSPGGSDEDFYADIVADEVDTDVINEKTAAAGVTIDGVLCKDSEVATDVINEKTAAAGVTVDGVLCKDGAVTGDVTGGSVAASTLLNSTGEFYMASHTPPAANGPGVTGRVSWDSSYIYVCVGPSEWKRVAISTW